MYKQKHQENGFVKEKLKFYQKEFDDIHQQFAKVADELISQKEVLNGRICNLKKQNSTLVDIIKVYKAKLGEYIFQTNLNETCATKVHHSAELAANVVVLNRKCVYLECENNSLEETIKQLEINLSNTKSAFLHKISKMARKIKKMANRFSIFENQCKTHVDATILQTMQEKLDNISLKYRILQQDYQSISTKDNVATTILNKSVELLQNEKNKLMLHLTATMTKFYLKDVGENAEILASKLAETEVKEITERQRANHVNNLYELVKEQLKKSEERFEELEMNNKELIQKNTILQQKLNDFQDKILNCVDLYVFKEIQSKFSNLLKQYEDLTTRNEKLLEDSKCSSKTIQTQKLRIHSQEFEYLSLKHQLVDLQAISDDKAIIARLSSDLLRARLSEASCEKKLDELSEENQELEQRCEMFENLLCEEIEKNKENLNQLDKQKW